MASAIVFIYPDIKILFSISWQCYDFHCTRKSRFFYLISPFNIGFSNSMIMRNVVTRKTCFFYSETLSINSIINKCIVIRLFYIFTFIFTRGIFIPREEFFYEFSFFRFPLRLVAQLPSYGFIHKYIFHTSVKKSRVPLARALYISFPQSRAFVFLACSTIPREVKWLRHANNSPWSYSGANKFLARPSPSFPSRKHTTSRKTNGTLSNTWVGRGRSPGTNWLRPRWVATNSCCLLM